MFAALRECVTGRRPWITLNLIDGDQLTPEQRAWIARANGWEWRIGRWTAIRIVVKWNF